MKRGFSLFLFLLAVLSVSNSFAQVIPAFAEPLEQAGLPDAGHWNFSSTGTGRIQVIPGVSDVLEPDSPTITAGTNRMRGNLFEATSSRALVAFDMYLDRPSAQTLSLAVYESTALAGPYLKVYDQTVSVTAGAGYVSTGKMFLPLHSGRFYITAAFWTANNSYQYEGISPLPSVAFGELRHGVTSGVSSPPSQIASPSTSAWVYRQRLRTVDMHSVPGDAVFTNSSSANLFRGSVLNVTQSTTLTGHEFFLGRSATTQVTFTVHEQVNAGDPYQELSRTTVAAPAGTGFVASPRIDIPLVSGRSYILGAHWDLSTLYPFQNSAYDTPQNLPFGTVVQGVTHNGSVGATFDGATTTTGYRQRFTTMENDAIRMDSSQTNSLSINRADLRLNLTGISQASLRFTHQSYGEEDHEEGIYLSGDQVTWHKILDLPIGSTGPTDYEVDLIAKAAEHAVGLDSTVYVRFQQQDDWTWDSDGRDFSNIRVTAPLDLAAHSLAQQIPVNGLMFRGFTDPKLVPFEFDARLRGGGGDVEGQAFDTRYILELPGEGTVLWSHTLSRSEDFPAYSVTDNAYDHSLSVPGSVLLPQIVYNLRAQLDPANAVAESREDNNEITAIAAVNHYSGMLLFNEVQTEIWISSWQPRSPLSPTDHRISGNGLINGQAFVFENLDVVKNLDTLHYHIDPDELQEISAGPLASKTFNGVRFDSDGPVILSRNGAYANLNVTLPAGAGWGELANQRDHSAHVQFQTVSLNSQLTPANAQVDFVGIMWLAEESKPLIFEISKLAWVPQAGIFEGTTTGNTEYVRRAEMDELDDYVDLRFIPDAMGIKASNEQYFRYAGVGHNEILVLGATADGVAQLTVNLALSPGEFTTHMPHGTKLLWNGAGVLSIQADVIMSNSLVDQVAPISVDYSKNCVTENCPDPEKNGTVTLLPDGDKLYFTRDGGLWAEGVFTDPHDLEWAFVPDSKPAGNYAHRAGLLSQGQFQAPGIFLRGDDAGPQAEENAPGVLLLSGTAWDNTQLAERPYSAAYTLGEGAYAGMNFRVQDSPGATGLSYVGLEPFGPYPLTAGSKYYVRASGLSGIHEAMALTQEATIFDYNFLLTRFGYSFLSNLPWASRTEGKLALGYPTDQVIDFEELMIGCKGDLKSAEPSQGSTELTLSYWQAHLDLYAMRFESSEGCEIKDSFLVFDIRTEAQYVPGFLFGTIGILPGGGLIRHADTPLGITSRLSVPVRMTLDGPEGEQYGFVPAHDIYLNHHASATGHQSVGEGYFSLAGQLDVPFFQDMYVHLHTRTGSEDASHLYLMGGWPDDGWKSNTNQTFFNSALFDAEHRGWPTAAGLSVADYRNGENEAYRPLAIQNWLDLIELKISLVWDDLTRTFSAPQAKVANLKVLDAQWQVEYLSPENVEISFGVQYDGLPRVNLSNFVFNQIDGQLGAAEAFVQGVGDDLFMTLLAGVSSMDKLLNDMAESLYEPILDNLVDPVIDELYTQLNQAYLNADSNYNSAVDDALDRVFGGIPTLGPTPQPVPAWNLPNSIQNMVKGLEEQQGQLIGGAITEVEQLQGLGHNVLHNLQEARKAVNSVNISFPSLSPGGTGDAVEGLLHRNGAGEYPRLTAMAGAFVYMFVEAADIAAPEGVSDTLRDLFKDATAGLDAVSSALTAVDGELEEVIGLLTDGDDLAGEFFQELNEIITPPGLAFGGISPAVEQLTQKVRDDIEIWLKSLPPGRNPMDDYSPQEFKARIRGEVAGALNTAPFTRHLQAGLRARLFDVDERFRKATDSLFQQVNKAMKDLLSETLAELDDSINGILGDMGDYIGAGQIDGYAHIRNDSLDRLRLDGAFQWKVPAELEFRGFLVVQRLQSIAGVSSSPGSCNYGAGRGFDITLGAMDLPCQWLGSDLRVNISTKFTIVDVPVGLAGTFAFADGSEGISFEAFTISELSAGAGFGLRENYISAGMRAELSSAEVAGGLFFGRACTLEPILLIDEDVGEVIGSPPFTGIYVFGEGWIPILDYGCVLNVGAGIGAGMFMFAEGPTYGAKIFAGVKGEALCVVSVRAEVTLIGVKEGGNLRARGRGTLSGKAGACPFCLKFKKSLSVTYDDGSWDADL